MSKNREPGLHYSDIMYMMFKRAKDYSERLSAYSPNAKRILTVTKCDACGKDKGKDLVHKAHESEHYLCHECYASTQAVVQELGDMLDKLNKKLHDS